MSTGLGVLILQFVLVHCLVLSVHALRRRLGRTPFLLLIGGLTAITSWSTDAWVVLHVSEVAFLVGSAICYTAVLLGVFVVYVLDGARAARTLIVSMIGVAILAGVMAMLFRLQLFSPQGSGLPVITPPNVRTNVAGILSTVTASLLLAIVWQTLHNKLGQLPLMIKVCCTLLSVFLADLMIFNALAFWGHRQHWDMLAGAFVGRLVAALLASPLCSIYFSYEGRRSGILEEDRPILSIVQELRNVTRELTATQQAKEKAERAMVRLRAMHDIDLTILESGSPAEVAEKALAHLLQLADLEEVTLFEYDLEHEQAEVIASAGRTGSGVRQGTTIPLHRFQIEALRLGEMAATPLFDIGDALHEGSRTLLQRSNPICCPLIARGELIGSLAIYSGSGDTLNDEQTQMVGEVSTSLAIGMHNARLTADLHRMATIDELTGTFNRRTLFELGTREIQRFKRSGRPLAAILLDLDCFKVINDTHGHTAGDLALKSVARCCQQAVRATDIVGRYGGDEMVVLLPESDLAMALKVAERLRLEAERLAVPAASSTLSLTISLGVAQLTQDDDLSTLLTRADAAMYAAKRAGRNLVRKQPERE